MTNPRIAGASCPTTPVRFNPPIHPVPKVTAVPTEREPLPRIWLLAPLALLVALLVMEMTAVDRTVSHWFYDTATHAFPLRQTFLLETVLHYWTKYLVTLVICLFAAAVGFTYLAPALRPRRRLLLFIALAMTLAPLVVTAMKQVTDRPCPWNLVEFGGAVPHTHLFEAREQPHARGLCFPAGHASTGFALLAFFFAAHREGRHRLARTALLAGLLAGLTLGLGRIAQGAHFVSHVLWSGVVCWLVMVGLYAAVFTPRPAMADMPDVKS